MKKKKKNVSDSSRHESREHHCFGSGEVRVKVVVVVVVVVVDVVVVIVNVLEVVVVVGRGIVVVEDVVRVNLGDGVWLLAVAHSDPVRK